MSLWEHSWLSLKCLDYQKSFLKTGIKQMSLLSSRRTRKIWGTTDAMISLASSEGGGASVFKHMKNKKLIRPIKNRLINGRSSLANLLAFYNGLTNILFWDCHASPVPLFDEEEEKSRWHTDWKSCLLMRSSFKGRLLISLWIYFAFISGKCLQKIGPLKTGQGLDWTTFIGLDKEGRIVLAIRDENKFDDLFL